MNASKENAIKAATDLRLAITKFKGLGKYVDFVADFLLAAHAKLPSEAAFAADKERRKQKV